MDAVLLASIPAILGIINLLKGLGLPTKAAAPIAVALGVALSVSDLYFSALPVYEAISSGLLLGLGATGLYDVAKMAGATVLGGSPTTVIAEAPTVKEGFDGAA